MSDNSECVIHIVDDEESMRTALSRLLRGCGYSVRCYASAGDFLVAEIGSGPGCLLLDMEMPGLDGLALQQAMRRIGRELPIIFMSAYRDIPRTVRAIKDGAVEFLVKPIAAETLLAALENALAVPAAVTHGDAPASPLSERERAVLRGIVAGRQNKQIAAELALSERTVKSCRAEVMRKFGAHSLAELVQRGASMARS